MILQSKLVLLITMLNITVSWIFEPSINILQQALYVQFRKKYEYLKICLFASTLTFNVLFTFLHLQYLQSRQIILAYLFFNC